MATQGPQVIPFLALGAFAGALASDSSGESEEIISWWFVGSWYAIFRGGDELGEHSLWRLFEPGAPPITFVTQFDHEVYLETWSPDPEQIEGLKMAALISGDSLSEAMREDASRRAFEGGHTPELFDVDLAIIGGELVSLPDF